MEETKAYLGFSQMSGIGPLRFKLLIDYFGTAEKAWVSSQKELEEIGLGSSITQKLVAFRQTFNVEKLKEDFAKKEIKVITRVDPLFPLALREIPDPPIVLYVKGTLPTDYSRCIGVVGTRKPTSYGREITERIARELVELGITIISGMARGVDGIAHYQSVVAKKPTVAVLGCGVDIIYPPEHKNLYREILSTGGAIISEVPPGHLVSKGLFPARNRIISGISRGVVVTEGTEDSGSLITAKLAVDQGREVFAVPGPINSYLSAGPTKLIKDGAKLVTCAQDILEELALPVKKSTNGKVRLVSPEQQKIIEALETGISNFDDIVRNSELSVSQVGTLLTLMELNGIVKSLGDGKYTLVS